MASLRDKPLVRWTALVLASLSIFGAYYFNYALSAIKPILESALGWTSSDFGTYTSAYGWFNVFLFMLIISGIILDKLGVRKTGLGATLIMFTGTAINYWAITHNFSPDVRIFGLKAQVFWSAIGFAIFGVGTEAIGITISKAVVRWFKGKEMALAMGMQMAIARLGTLLALSLSIPLAQKYSVDGPITFALILMLIGIISFLTFSVLDIKLDKSLELEKSEGLGVTESEEEFKLSDIKYIITNRGFWYIALLCVLFYSAVFPFLFYANDLMINKYSVPPNLAGLIPSLLPFGTILLTPLFGTYYDHKGKGATIMIIGSLLLILVHGVLSIPFLTQWWVAATMVIILGIGFSLVPSAMWPSVPKIIPEKQLGTAYAVIFWIQNIGLLSVPLLLGIVLNATNPNVVPNKQLVKSGIEIAFKSELKNKLDTKQLNLIIEKVSTKAVDSVIKSVRYQPTPQDQINTNQFRSELANQVKQAVDKILQQNPSQEELQELAVKAATDIAANMILKYKLNIRYNYEADLLIFLTLSLLSLVFALLLKAEDKRKGYGLEEPNIEKVKKETA